MQQFARIFKHPFPRISNTSVCSVHPIGRLPYINIQYLTKCHSLTEDNLNLFVSFIILGKQLVVKSSKLYHVYVVLTVALSEHAKKLS